MGAGATLHAQAVPLILHAVAQLGARCSQAWGSLWVISLEPPPGTSPNSGCGAPRERRSLCPQALRVKVKCDSAGVGHNAAEQFSFHWWDHVFNESAANIAVEDGQVGGGSGEFHRESMRGPHRTQVSGWGGGLGFWDPCSWQAGLRGVWDPAASTLNLGLLQGGPSWPDHERQAGAPGGAGASLPRHVPAEEGAAPARRAAGEKEEEKEEKETGWRWSRG
uniref:Uncharacterized protein n=1 Tax=Anas zonorhyncha TaxID=75864 RepID=A0A8B9V2X6_9AVES